MNVTHAKEIVRRFRALDKTLQNSGEGWHVTSPEWHRAIEAFYLRGVRQWVIRAGRRAGKSSTLCRLAVCEALWGHHKVPAGDVGVVAIVAQNKDEAGKRVRTIRAILDTLGIRHTPASSGIEIADPRYRPILFSVFAASVQGVSGFTSIFVLCDEVSKWKDADTGANPAREVLASLRPTMATQKDTARIVLSSSPVGRWDAHYDAFEEGETAFQTVFHAPTWRLNPTLTEADTHGLEPDDAVWRREYAAIPADELTESLLTGEELDGCTRTELTIPPERGHAYFAAMDYGTRRNAWTLVVSTMRRSPLGPRPGSLRKSIVLAREWIGTSKTPLDPDKILREVQQILQPYEVDVVFSDQASGDALRALALRHGLSVVILPWTQPMKAQVNKDLQTWVRTDLVELPPDKTVRQDLLGVVRKYTRTGMLIDWLKTPDGRHSDYAPAIAVALSRSLVPPLEYGPDEGTAEWEQAQVAARKKRFQAERSRPEWAPSHTADRGASAWWRR